MIATMPNVQMARALVGAHFPRTLGWFIPQLFGHYPPRILPVYEMRKVTDTEAPLLARETHEKVERWLLTHV